MNTIAKLFGLFRRTAIGFLAAIAPMAPAMAAARAAKAFPDAVGFGVETPGGRGGQVIKVTNLNVSGPGSLGAAVSAKGPRIVVFEVGGVIDLGRRSLRIQEPFLTIAGQTAPSPGITLIRGGVSISTHDVVVRHIRVRCGDAGAAKRSGWEPDALSTSGPGCWNVVVDQCSLAWAIDENLSASGARFEGAGVDQWREHTSHDVTFSRCIVAEGLSRASHKKNEHSKGSLIHDNATRIAVLGNLYASNVDRNPLFKGGVRGVVVNNLIHNPLRHAVRYRLVASEWEGHPFVTGQMALVGNVFQHGPNTPPTVPLLSYEGDGPLELFARDNQAFDKSGQARVLIAVRHVKPEELRSLDAPPLWPKGLEALPADQVRKHVLATAGARPWDRDEVDRRIVQEVASGSGQIIDSQEEVGGYPRPQPTARKLNVPDTNMEAWLESFSE